METVFIEVPSTWVDLLSIEAFPEYCDGMRAGDRHEKPADSPEAFYDDSRTLPADFQDGVQFDLKLASGQSNYWLEGIFYGSAPECDVLDEGEPQHSLCDGEEWEYEGHVVRVKLV